MSAELIEYFNTTNQTSPHYERHLSFANPVVPERCELITLLDPNERCEFATYSKSCLQHVYIFNYNQYFYCTCDANDLSRLVCVLILFLIGALQFWIIYATTIGFFVPALQVISKLLNMNEYIAGITIMTFGNNIPTLISTISGEMSEARHVYTDTMSVNLFESIFTSAIIMWVSPFAIAGTFFLRDVGFFLLYTTYVDLIFKLSNGDINIVRASSMVSIYVIYITVVILDQYLQYLDNKSKQMKDVPDSRQSRPIGIDSQVMPHLHNHNLLNADGYKTPNQHLMKQFFAAFDIWDRDNFNSNWTIFKLWALVKVPPMIFLCLIIPQMYFQESSFQWSKLLLCIQLVLTPNLIVLAYTFESYPQVLAWVVITFVILLVISISIFAVTRTDRVPKWYHYVGIMTMVSCVTVIYFVGKELVFLLEALGIILDRSHTFIGCTFYTWGNGLPHLLANVSMAKEGYPRMAFSACFGVVIFSIFTSICLPVLYQAINSPSGIVKLTEGTVGETTSIILIISLIMLIIYGITTNFMLRRTGALIGITLYLLFLIFGVTSEFEFTHAFGTDHSLDRSHYDERYSEVP